MVTRWKSLLMLALPTDIALNWFHFEHIEYIAIFNNNIKLTYIYVTGVQNS